MFGDEDDECLTTREVYRLLRGAPTNMAALRLASRLRSAAKQGRTLKDGRKVDLQRVNDAMDKLLASKSLADDVAQGTRSAPVSSQAPSRPRLRARVPAQEPEEPEELGQELWEGLQQEPQGPEPEEGPGPRRRRRERREPRHEDFNEYVQWEGAEEEEREEPDYEPQVSEVPQEVYDSIINNKFNVVDRIWSAPEASALPRAPALEVDSTAPKDSWLRLPHVAVNGMTNCGKSSLINHILNWDFAAKASSRPGRTTSIDFYCVNNRFLLVDLPGYPDPDEIAYMGVMKNWESHWEDLVISYLEFCARGDYDLRLLLHLQGTMKRPSRMCQRFVDEVKRLEHPMMLILTKDDQHPKGHEVESRNYHMKRIRSVLDVDGHHLHYTTTSKLPSSRKARKQLHRWIRSCLNAESSDACREMLHNVWANRKPQPAAPKEREATAEAAMEPAEVAS